jgi:S-adenosylmethionine decarboxylase
VTRALGIHLLLDVAGVPFALLDDDVLLERLLMATVDQMGAALLGVHIHRLEPQGVSGVAIISESHLTIHTWPERGEAAVDLFTCGDAARARAALDWLRWSMGGRASRFREIARGALLDG